jgi:hypothetical protein
MLNPTAAPMRPRVLVVDDELAKLDTALGRAAESVAAALDARNVDVVRALSYEDGHAIAASDASLRAVLLDWNLGLNSEGTHAQATALLQKLRERNAASRQAGDDPAPTASPIFATTMGIVAVARLAARLPGVPWATITLTLERTSSAANSGSRSYFGTR